MKIAVIGTGHVGSVLGTRWAKSGHEVIWGTRDPNSDKIHALLKEIGPNAHAARFRLGPWTIIGNTGRLLGLLVLW